MWSVDGARVLGLCLFSVGMVCVLGCWEGRRGGWCLPRTQGWLGWVEEDAESLRSTGPGFNVRRCGLMEEG